MPTNANDEMQPAVQRPLNDRAGTVVVPLVLAIAAATCIVVIARDLAGSVEVETPPLDDKIAQHAPFAELLLGLASRPLLEGEPETVPLNDLLLNYEQHRDRVVRIRGRVSGMPASPKASTGSCLFWLTSRGAALRVAWPQTCSSIASMKEEIELSGLFIKEDWNPERPALAGLLAFSVRDLSTPWFRGQAIQVPALCINVVGLSLIGWRVAGERRRKRHSGAGAEGATS